jgi:hypothetical protein
MTDWSLGFVGGIRGMTRRRVQAELRAGLITGIDDGACEISRIREISRRLRAHKIPEMLAFLFEGRLAHVLL